MAFAQRPRFTWRLRTRSLPLGRRTLLMGILNVTPDSFSDGSRFFAPQNALNHALELLDQGADLIDLGGESTRPNSTPVSADEEQERILPVLHAILKAPSSQSIPTTQPPRRPQSPLARRSSTTSPACSGTHAWPRSSPPISPEPC